LHLAARGARVALLGRTESDLQTLAREIADAGGAADVIVADVSKLASMRRAFARIKKLHGRLDLVLANAGVNGVWAPLDRLEVAEWDTTLAINLRGTFLTCKFAIELMPRSGGSIVVISSVNGTRMFSNTGASAYAASKAAQVAFARMIALELAPRRIRVNTICPGAIKSAIGENTVHRGLARVRTPVKFPEGQVPLTGGKPGRAEDVARLAAFLLSDDAAHITGTEVFIDGAQSLLQG
ncbi:MAG: SDR family oxidoreductase, partial [Burkholderiales bacterium]|nr:SDR family oxidoreductase [Opitutaceae bacterium]